MVDRLHRERIRPAIRASIVAQMMGTVLPTLLRTGGVSSLLIIALLGPHSEFHVGLAFLVMQWSMLIRLLASPWVDISRRQRFLVRGMLASSIASIGFLLVPLIGMVGPPRTAVWVFLVFLAVYFLLQSVGSAAWFPLLQYIVPSRLRGRYFGSMRQHWQIISFGAVFLAGMFLGEDPAPAVFALILFPAIILQFGRVAMCARLPDPPPVKSAENGMPFIQRLAQPFRDKKFRGFMMYIALISLAQHSAVPFVVPFLKTSLDFPASYTLYSTAIFGAGSVISLVFWGRLTDQRGNRAVFVLTLAIGAIAFLLLAVTPEYIAGRRFPAMGVAACGMLLAGIATAGIGIAHTVRLMHLAPPSDAGPYLNADQAMIGTISGLAALGAGAVLNYAPPALSLGAMSLSSYRLLFLAVAAGMTILAFRVRRLPRISEPALRSALKGVFKPALLRSSVSGKPAGR